MPDVLTLWSLAVLVVGGLMYLAMSRASATWSRAIAWASATARGRRLSA
jgi:hypothetical protein